MGKWFETGNKMANGTPRTVYADGDIAIDEARKKRWKEVSDDKEISDTPQGTKIEGVTGVSTRKVGLAHEVFRNELVEDEVATAEEVAEEVVEEVATAEEVAEEFEPEGWREVRD